MKGSTILTGLSAHPYYQNTPGEHDDIKVPERHSFGANDERSR